MHSSALLLLSLLSTAFAFEVTAPAKNQGWTNNGPQTVTWKRVSTDSTNFTIVLTNQNRALLPSDIVLAPFVDATAGSSINVNPPTGGWPSPGSSYRVNLVRDANQQNTIYAQSTEFSIVNGPATVITSDSASTSSTSGSQTGSSNAGPGGSTFGGGSVTFPPAKNETTGGESEGLIGTGGNGASSSRTLSAGLLAGVAALVGSTLL